MSQAGSGREGSPPSASPDPSPGHTFWSGSRVPLAEERSCLLLVLFCVCLSRSPLSGVAAMETTRGGDSTLVKCFKCSRQRSALNGAGGEWARGADFSAFSNLITVGGTSSGFGIRGSGGVGGTLFPRLTIDVCSTQSRVVGGSEMRGRPGRRCCLRGTAPTSVPARARQFAGQKRRAFPTADQMRSA